MVDDHPVSYPQQGLWILDRLDPGQPTYAVPIVHRIDGELDTDALALSIGEVIGRHEVLRTVYRRRGRAVRQVVLPAEPVRLPIVDLTAHRDPEAEAARLADAEARVPFDLSTGPVVRQLLLRTGPGRHWLCLTLHHIACDGWSLQILGDELSAAYRSLVTGTAPRLRALPEQYADFAEWQAEQQDSPAVRAALGYWRRRLGDLPALSTIPADRPSGPLSGDGANVPFTVAKPVSDRVDHLAGECRATPFAVLLAAFAALIHARNGGRDAVIGMPVTARERESHQHLIGMFVNSVVIRLAAADATCFRDLVCRARDESRAAIAHRNAPFDSVVAELSPPRTAGIHPVFQLMITYQGSAPGGLTLPGCAVTSGFGDTATTKVDMSLSLTRTGTGYSGRLEYSTDLFEASTARHLVDQFQEILATGTADPLGSLVA
ncbi:condensation domain-containing protein [Actinoplanes oblitus]|uniref:Condensation domain-containing protein n=1 Tax=Actinoplanes oblitus TaxID=3040509 RepID=A0ABY8W9S4_9ACTN|nr:condensation domain-containing protein [Actinoplanes oblitus]WIM94418.1 condensation domain-containing protein [Actinoplanes oblitus]